MITEHDLNEAIAECLGKRNPDSSTCIKLAAFYTIKEQLYGQPQVQTEGYSFASVPTVHNTINLTSGSRFASTVNGMDPEKVLPIFDELMEAVSVYNKPLYNATMRKLEDWS